MTQKGPTIARAPQVRHNQLKAAFMEIVGELARGLLVGFIQDPSLSQVPLERR